MNAAFDNCAQLARSEATRISNLIADRMADSGNDDAEAAFAHICTTGRPNTINRQGYDADGNQVDLSTQHSADVMHDILMMDGFLVLEKAVAQGGAQIDAHKLGSLWLSSTPPVSVADMGQENQTLRARNRMLQAELDKALADSPIPISLNP